MSRYTIEFRIVDKYAAKVWSMAVDEDEFPIFDERSVDAIRHPGPVPFREHNFEGLVRIFKERKFRREYLIDAANSLARRLADYLEDSEGWNGEGRRDKIKEMRK